MARAQIPVAVAGILREPLFVSAATPGIAYHFTALRGAPVLDIHDLSGVSYVTQHEVAVVASNGACHGFHRPLLMRGGVGGAERHLCDVEGIAIRTVIEAEAHGGVDVHYDEGAAFELVEWHILATVYLHHVLSIGLPLPVARASRDGDGIVVHWTIAIEIDWSIGGYDIE